MIKADTAYLASGVGALALSCLCAVVGDANPHPSIIGFWFLLMMIITLVGGLSLIIASFVMRSDP